MTSTSSGGKETDERRQKILIVEDEPDMVLGLRDNFEFEGYVVVTASDGAAGLEKARAEKPDP
jgi:DNA-binding response OmpR family regulator